MGLKNSEIRVLDRDSGKKKNSFTLPGPINSSLVVDSNGVLYVGCEDGYIYLLDSSNGKYSLEIQDRSGEYTLPRQSLAANYISVQRTALSTHLSRAALNV